VGATGAGKTSLAYLAPRFHAPTSGDVLIDGNDVAHLTLGSLRSQVAYVFQETQLFSLSIADNIRYGRPEASMEAVIAAATTAGAHDFVLELPEGYETNPGARGAKLSVGQRQRIAIARALIMETPILILDEPTSARDPDTERYLVDALHTAAKGRCVIVITHRLSTIARADKVAVLENGALIEQGRPGELLARPGSAYGRSRARRLGDELNGAPPSPSGGGGARSVTEGVRDLAGWRGRRVLSSFRLVGLAPSVDLRSTPPRFAREERWGKE
jgi:ABC-type multidrug transport system fused ATPase/permease subunit